MPYRYYTDEEKEQALDVLQANNGELTLTSTLTGIAKETLLRWQRKLRPTLLITRPKNASSTSSTTTTSSWLAPEYSDDDVQELIDLKHTLLKTAKLLVLSIAPAIAEAPLPQRITGAIQLIDRVMKMSAELPKADDDEEIVYEIVGAETFERDGEDEEDEDNEAELVAPNTAS